MDTNGYYNSGDRVRVPSLAEILARERPSVLQFGDRDRGSISERVSAVRLGDSPSSTDPPRFSLGFILNEAKARSEHAHALAHGSNHGWMQSHSVKPRPEDLSMTTTRVSTLASSRSQAKRPAMGRPEAMSSSARGTMTATVAAVSMEATVAAADELTSNGKLKATRKKPRAAAKQTATTISYEEKRKSRQCKVDDCDNYTINKGLCFRHGGGKKCTVQDCNASSKINGLCWKHGGSVQCTTPGCKRRGKSRGLCWSHGGGTLCQTDDCTKVAVSNGLCWAHGGGKRCLYDGCERPAYERTLNYCPKHFERYEKGEEVLEV